MEPVFPVKFIVVELVPGQTDVLFEIAPETAFGFTIIEITGVFTATQIPLEQTVR